MSYFVKREVVESFINIGDDIIIVDPEREYSNLENSEEKEENE